MTAIRSFKVVLDIRRNGMRENVSDQLAWKALLQQRPPGRAWGARGLGRRLIYRTSPSGGSVYGHTSGGCGGGGHVVVSGGQRQCTAANGLHRRMDCIGLALVCDGSELQSASDRGVSDSTGLQ